MTLCVIVFNDEQVKDEKPPAPTRGIAPKGDGEEDGQEEGGEDGGDGAAAEPAVNLADLVPRNDIRYCILLAWQWDFGVLRVMYS